MGLTKHIGGVEATDSIAELCHINKDSYVLDVGCGVGVTPCYLAKRYGCRVVGVDILEAMIARSRERAQKEQVSNKVVFKVADAQSLPFEDETFDAVITESVTAFPEGKQKAVNEYARVTKRGGYMGLNESTWLKVPPPPELIAWASQDLGANLRPLTTSDWAELLKNARLQDIVVKTYNVVVKDESKGILRRYGFGGMMRVLWRILGLYLRSPAYRNFVKDVKEHDVTPKNLSEYFGYGLFVGRKE